MKNYLGLVDSEVVKICLIVRSFGKGLCFSWIYFSFIWVDDVGRCGKNN